MSSEKIIKLLSDNEPWQKWDTCYRTVFCLMFLPLVDFSLDGGQRAEARRLNVQIFNRNDRTPPKFVIEILESMPPLTAKYFYSAAKRLRSALIVSGISRPSSWPSIN